MTKNLRSINEYYILSVHKEYSNKSENISLNSLIELAKDIALKYAYYNKIEWEDESRMFLTKWVGYCKKSRLTFVIDGKIVDARYGT